MQSLKRPPSVKRNALYIGVASLSVSLIVLSVGVAMGHPAAVEIGAVAGSLATVVGYSYVRGKAIEAGAANNEP